MKGNFLNMNIVAIRPLSAGTPEPNFALKSTPDQTVSLRASHNRPVVLFSMLQIDNVVILFLHIETCLKHSIKG